MVIYGFSKLRGEPQDSSSSLGFRLEIERCTCGPLPAPIERGPLYKRPWIPAHDAR
jgi:hypothetical protein